MMTTYFMNGHTHILKSSVKGAKPKSDNEFEAACGFNPIPEGARSFSVLLHEFDPVTEVPKHPCRPCLMVAAMSDEVVGEEPLEFARQRGYEPKDEKDFDELGLL